MDSGQPAAGDILQVIPRRPSSSGPPPEGTGSRRIILLPARRRKLARIVLAAVGACGLILVAAGVAHVLRPAVDTASAATAPAAPPPVPAPATANPPAAAPAAPPDTPQTGTVHVARPASPGKVWLDGQKLTTASATVACGDHQLKVGHGKAHAITVPCGGDLKVSR
jgi:hypothetical protein